MKPILAILCLALTPIFNWYRNWVILYSDVQLVWVGTWTDYEKQLVTTQAEQALPTKVVASSKRKIIVERKRRLALPGCAKVSPQTQSKVTISSSVLGNQLKQVAYHEFKHCAGWQHQ